MKPVEITCLNQVATHSGSAWVVSLCLHLGALLLMGCIYWKSTLKEERGLIVTFGPEFHVEQFTPIVTIPKEQGEGGAQAEVRVNQIVKDQVADDEVREIRLEQPLSIQNALTQVFETTELTSHVKANIKNLTGLRYLAGLNQGDGVNGDGTGAGSFLSTAPTYRRIVYVVDASGSMNHPHESPALTRIGRVKVELLRSIDSLEPHQEFFVIYFTESALPMPSRRGFIARGAPDLDEYLTWMAKHLANGNTDPRLALQMAFDMEPDVVFFLTDGQVNPFVAKDIIRFNQKRIKINTICIGSAPSEHLMQQIALKHQGIYTFVP